VELNHRHADFQSAALSDRVVAKIGCIMRFHFLPRTAHPDSGRILLAKAFRAFADGFVSILLPAYLLALGLDALRIGILTSITLFGSAGLTLSIGFLSRRVGLHRLFLVASGLMALTGIGFASFTAFWPMLIIGFVGTLNPSSGDVSMFLPLEQAFLADAVAERDRTTLFARYSVIGGLSGAVGAQFAAAPDLLSRWLDIESLALMRGMFIVYALIGVIAGIIYRSIATADGTELPATKRALGPSRSIVTKLAALFSVDAFAGGFIVQSILALWLFNKFDLSLITTANIFFWLNLGTALSYVAAAPIARRFGLINTMVFTHLPSSLCLLAVPFAPSLWLAIVLLLVRSLLSQMDVPTRTSYVMAVVTPAERPSAASVTSVPRSLAAAVSPTIAGYLLSLSPFGWPLVICATLKIAYDLTLLGMFRNIRPPEEQ
jgi:MFS family permease